MLDELKNLDCRSGKDGLLFFIRDVIGNGKITLQDAEVISSHSLGNKILAVEDLLKYCLTFGWISYSNGIISVSPRINSILQYKEELNSVLIASTVEQLFDSDLLKPDMFSYDVIQDCYVFRDVYFSLSLSNVRNMLTSQGFFISKKDSKKTKFYISKKYEILISKYCKEKHKKISLDMLKQQMETNELAGEKAEQFVLVYEKNRVGPPLCEKIKRISEIDTNAGYDIVSFKSHKSSEVDCFIEVKAVSKDGFYWSKNEFEIAKLKGEDYYLYLVELNKINSTNYSPIIIQNPVQNIINSDEWFVETQTYHIKHI